MRKSRFGVRPQPQATTSRTAQTSRGVRGSSPTSPPKYTHVRTRLHRQKIPTQMKGSRSILSGVERNHSRPVLQTSSKGVRTGCNPDAFTPAEPRPHMAERNNSRLILQTSSKGMHTGYKCCPPAEPRPHISPNPTRDAFRHEDLSTFDQVPIQGRVSVCCRLVLFRFSSSFAPAQPIPGAIRTSLQVAALSHPSTALKQQELAGLLRVSGLPYPFSFFLYFSSPSSSTRRKKKIRFPHSKDITRPLSSVFTSFAARAQTHTYTPPTHSQKPDPKTNSKGVSVIILAIFQQPRRVACLHEFRGLGHNPPVSLGSRFPPPPLQLQHGAVRPRELSEVGRVAAERGPQQGLVDGVMGDDEGPALVLDGLEGADLLPGVAGPCPKVSRGVPVCFVWVRGWYIHMWVPACSRCHAVLRGGGVIRMPMCCHVRTVSYLATLCGYRVDVNVLPSIEGGRGMC